MRGTLPGFRPEDYEREGRPMTIPDQLTESQAPGFLTDEQAHYWADGWNACRERMVDDEADLLDTLRWAQKAVDRLVEVTPAGLHRDHVRAKADEMRAMIARREGQ